ncbi:MAG: energy transducer TonB [Rhodothermaceae bacterium]|nr:energy transducer TonB [Rhodothermaceae bacterium]
MQKGKPFRNEPDTVYLIRYQVCLAVVLIVLIIIFRVNISHDRTSDRMDVVSTPVAFLEIERTVYAEKPSPPPRPVSGIDKPVDVLIDEEIILLRDREYYFRLPFRLVESDLSHLARPLLGEVEREPKLLTDTRHVTRGLPYPQEARMAGVQGFVVVEFTVNPHGYVVNPRIVEGLGWGCDEVAMNAIKRFRFRPALRDGIAVSVELRETVYFKLI